ncbi:DUF975 family protein [Pseudomonas sp. ZM23]|uniref:DUF975 family protein n=1 Tax=Pseudomonas triclosanedens TaxID=2961893 RepID=A0ABY6ZXN9_9PSED|nr:DUF975 family protein [Pseudomonas triclosanedens]MCP8463161.1 DUF975 family protein [Pseudomonas triclosanedens]MCP8469780.1 DUF975 family protein [Pseudomonas triclosanedens]MCP8473962.1 DUF975 family protein [Pseudomonas triclosanedens]WAI48639.1 DUF975 family protein [Pseudomonas triclosanedens]
MQDITSQNPYSPPQSNLGPSAAPGSVPSIAEALNRGYDFRIGDLLGEAWRLTKGTKGMIVSGFIVYMVIVQVISFVLGMALGLSYVASGTEAGMGMAVLQMVAGVFAAAVGYPFLAGINMLGIRRAADQPLSFNEMFGHFGLFVPLFITGLVMTLLIYLGLLILVLPGIYLSVAYILAIPLVVERKLSPWQALETSRKAITQHWFKVFGMFLALGVIVLVSAIPLGIGLVWTLPLAIIAIGVLYRTIFGVLPLPN